MMLSDWPRIELATRLRTMNRILDRILLDPRSADLEEALTIALDYFARNEIEQAAGVVKEFMKANPFWLRGYLLLATIYQEAHVVEKAIATIESGINICRASLRSLAMQSCSRPMSGVFSHEVWSRIQRLTARLSRYEQILQYRLLLVLVQAVHFAEALQCWTELENPHRA